MDFDCTLSGTFTLPQTRDGSRWLYATIKLVPRLPGVHRPLPCESDQHHRRTVTPHSREISYYNPLGALVDRDVFLFSFTVSLGHPVYGVSGSTLHFHANSNYRARNSRLLLFPQVPNRIYTGTNNICLLYPQSPSFWRDVHRFRTHNQAKIVSQAKRNEQVVHPQRRPTLCAIGGRGNPPTTCHGKDGAGLCFPWTSDNSLVN